MRRKVNKKSAQSHVRPKPWYKVSSRIVLLLGAALILLSLVLIPRLWESTKPLPELPKGIMRQAAKLADQHKYDQAIQLLEEYQQNHSSTTLVNYSLAAMYGKKGKERVAERYLQKELSLNPDHADSYRLLGVVYERLGQIEKALESYREQARLEPQNWKPYYQMGVLMRRYQNRLSESEEALTRAVELNPKAAKPLIELGKVYSQKQEYEKARSYFSRALRLNSDDPEAMYQLGKVLVRLGHEDRGHALLKQYKTLAQERDVVQQLERAGTAQHSYRAGQKYFSQRNAKKAMKAFQKAVDLDPHFWRGYLGTGMVYMVTRRFDRALQSFQKAYELAPNEFDVNYRLALVHAVLKHKDEARQALATAQTVRPLNLEEARTATQTWIQASMVEEGLAIFQEAISRYPENHEAKANFAFLLHQLRRYKQAEFYYKKAANISPTKVSYKIALASALAAQSRKEEAKQMLSRSLRDVPDAKIWDSYQKLRRLPGSNQLQPILVEVVGHSSDAEN